MWKKFYDWMFGDEGNARAKFAKRTQRRLDSYIYSRDEKGEVIIPCSNPSCHKCEERTRILRG